MTRLNLLPWREMRRREQDRQLLVVGAGAAVAMLLVVYLGHARVGAMIESQNARNTFLEREIARVDEEISEIREIKKKREELIARMQVIQSLQADRSRVVHIFDEMVRRMPEGAHLTTVKQVGDTFTLMGNAQSNARVSALMRNLDGSGWLSKPDLDVINVVVKGSDRISQFTLRVTQKKTEAEVASIAPPRKP